VRTCRTWFSFFWALPAPLQGAVTTDLDLDFAFFLSPFDVRNYSRKEGVVHFGTDF
jgi:hypothetical protein